MRLTLLGTAAGGGVPQWNCACRNCRRARAGEAAVPRRTQVSLAVSADGESWLVLEAAPEILAQIAATPALQPRGTARDSPIAAVLPTSAEVDHVAGLLSLRERHAFSLYGTASVLGALAANPIFAALDAALVPRRPVAPAVPIDVLGLEITPLALPAKPPLYDEQRPTVADDVIAVVIAQGKKRVCWVPGCASVTPALREALQGADLIFLDGTLWTDDELAEAGLGTRSARRMGHLPLSGPGGLLAALDGVTAGRRLLVHLNNSNPVVAADSPERAAVRALGWEVGEDGQEFAL